MMSKGEVLISALNTGVYRHRCDVRGDVNSQAMVCILISRHQLERERVSVITHGGWLQSFHPYHDVANVRMNWYDHWRFHSNYAYIEA